MKMLKRSILDPRGVQHDEPDFWLCWVTSITPLNSDNADKRLSEKPIQRYVVNCKVGLIPGNFIDNFRIA